MSMDCQSHPADAQANDVGMALGWQPDVYSKLVGDSEYALDSTDADKQYMSNDLVTHTGFGDIFSPLPDLEPFPPNHGLLGDTMDPTTLWPDSMGGPNMAIPQPNLHPTLTAYDRPLAQSAPLSSSPLTAASRPSLSRLKRSSSTNTSTIPEERDPSLHASTRSSMTSHSANSASPGESEKTRRARYAANQRHSKAQHARKDSAHHETAGEVDARTTERKQRHREKNKVAAAKCRSRQRKQVQTIQEKGSRLGEQNAELKTMIQELRGELNGLRSMALDHQECNCHVARYNHSQAERVVAEYRSSCMNHAFGGFGQVPQRQDSRAQ